MMMIYANPINLRSFEVVFYAIDLIQEANAPSLLHNKRQQYHI